MSTVYSCLPGLTTVYTYNYPCLHMFNFFYTNLRMFAPVYSWLAIFIILFTYVYPCLLVFAYI